MYSTDAITVRIRQAGAQKNGRYRVSQPIHWLIAVPPIQDEIFRDGFEPPSSALPVDHHRR